VDTLRLAVAIIRRHWILLIPLALVPPLMAPTTAANAASSPNIVIIMTDDQRWDTVTSQYMPHLTRILSQNPSIIYTNAFVPNSLCCPSRTSTLTGDYSHTTGVYGNGGQWGGFMSFTLQPEGSSISSVNDATTMAVDLQQAGYRTALVGKYLNQYPRGHYDYVPPGWNRWFSVGTGVYYNYRAASNGKKSRLFGTAPKDYITRVLTARATSFIDAPSTKPFFLYYATTAPHEPSIADPRDVGRFDLNGYAQPASFGKAEAGAPNYIQALPWDSNRVKMVNSLHRRQLDAIYGVDRSIGKVWSAIPENTVVLFMSDNGMLWGEHRWDNKQVPYNESLRVPIMIVGKDLQTPLPSTTTDSRIVLNVDVVPTLEAMAGVVSGHPLEGLNMFTSAREDFVLEHWQGAAAQVPTYCGIRSADWMYVRYNKDEEAIKEGLYDENVDPWEMNNLAVTDPADPSVATELQTMRDRAATLCQADGGLYPNDWPFPG
jgi:arylsulfatase A-like enzyme